MKCENVQPLLSEFIDNALSARDTFEVDKHLAECNPCARMLNEMRHTVNALAEMPRFEVSVDFMEKLQGRIAAVEPVPAPRAWRANLAALFRPRAIPAWGAACATCALAVVMVLNLRMPDKPPSGGGQVVTAIATEPMVVHEAKIQNVAASAANPLEDISAANLVAHTSSTDTEADSETLN